MTTQQRPDTAAVFAGLKDFQRQTVDHVTARLFDEAEPSKRFLVADEVGLGKTLVARGVIAATVDRLWDTDRRIDIVYICSNSQIARQNLRKLNFVDRDQQQSHADRITLLPYAMGQLSSRKINFVSFTPGTSFQLGNSGGQMRERVLLLALLGQILGKDHVRPKRWLRFFQGGAKLANFKVSLDAHDPAAISPEFVQAFSKRLKQKVTKGSRPFLVELDECVERFSYLRKNQTPTNNHPDLRLRALSKERYKLIGQLRQMIADESIDALEPDLVILDEFQRFTSLLSGEGEDAALAKAVFDHEDAKVLLLSATPYKMYTLPDEADGEDHYKDFLSTVRFLAGPDRAETVRTSLASLRENLLADGDLDAAKRAKGTAQAELRRVMVRTERLGSTANRDGMLQERSLGDLSLKADDVRTYAESSKIAKAVGSSSVLEYWRSSPYLFNFMENYKLKSGLREKIGVGDPATIEAVRGASSMLQWDDIESYRPLDPGNAKMRALSKDVLDRGTWNIAWLPPTLPYYALGGAYANPHLGDFTKRLIFSSWAVVPKAIGIVLSYEAERRITGEPDSDTSYKNRQNSPLLQFRMDGDRPAGMPTLALVYPSVVLSRLGDPLNLARRQGNALTISQACDAVRADLEPLVDRLTARHATPGSRVDQAWYWAAPMLLDRQDDPAREDAFGQGMTDWVTWEGENRSSGFARHVEQATSVDQLVLGPPPDDLLDVLVEFALAGPANCALRSLDRVCNAPEGLASRDLRDWAYAMAADLRGLFNRPEIKLLLKGDSGQDRYWRTVLQHSLDGCLQAVLDEYVHMQVDDNGIADKDAYEAGEVISEQFTGALGAKTVSNKMDEFMATATGVEHEEHLVRLHFAARLGAASADDGTVVREAAVRDAFNSPFWPFVLASTSVGQEGLDFHHYSHAVVHWNLPGNPVDLEQREGRVHRYKGHAVRKNVVSDYAGVAFASAGPDPWKAMFDAALAGRTSGQNDLYPYWLHTTENGATIERYVPTLPLSVEAVQYQRLLRTMGAYRLVLGQPRQEDLLRYLGDSVENLDWLQIDLSPAASPSI